MNRDQLLKYEPFEFRIDTVRDVYYLNAPTSVKGFTADDAPVTVFADGHLEFLHRSTHQRLVIEGVLPYFRDDARLTSPDKFEEPRHLASCFNQLLADQEVVSIYCNYLSFFGYGIIRTFSWEPVADSEGDIRYSMTIDTGLNAELPPKGKLPLPPAE